MEQQLYTFIIFSENLAGLLSQVAAVFTRRQVNIESLNVSASSIEGLHRYTITCNTDADTAAKIAKQVEKKVDVVQANYYCQDKIFIMETALFKLSTPAILDNKEISKQIRLHDAKMVEVNPTYTIVTKSGMTEEIVSLYEQLQVMDCLLQYVRSGAVAITTSHRERLSEFLAECEAEYSKSNE